MKRAERADIAVIIVGVNSCRYVRECLQSLARAEWRDRTYELIYVDNGSTDDTLTMVGNEFPAVRVIANPTNLGFCKAANQGAAVANSRYYFFLNDDTVVLEDAICRLAEFLDRLTEGGMVGSRLLNIDYSDQWSGRRFPSAINAVFGRRSVLGRIFPNIKPLAEYLYKDQLKGTAPFAVDWVSAAAMMVDAETFHQSGGFAESYYYFHELIICKRLSTRGRKVYLHPLSKIIHYEGAGSGTRPYPVKKSHIINFHVGAYRWYCEHHGLSRISPRRWACAAAVAVRAMVLIGVARAATFRQSLKSSATALIHP